MMALEEKSTELTVLIDTIKSAFEQLSSTVTQALQQSGQQGNEQQAQQTEQGLSQAGSGVRSTATETKLTDPGDDELAKINVGVAGTNSVFDQALLSLNKKDGADLGRAYAWLTYGMQAVNVNQAIQTTLRNADNVNVHINAQNSDERCKKACE